MNFNYQRIWKHVGILDGFSCRGKYEGNLGTKKCVDLILNSETFGEHVIDEGQSNETKTA